MGKRKIKTKEMLSRKDAVKAVKALLVGLEKGEILVGEGKDQLCFGVPDDMKLSLKGKLKGAKAKVTLSLAWKHEGEVPVEVGESGPPAKTSKAEPPAKKTTAKVPAKAEPAKGQARKKPEGKSAGKQAAKPAKQKKKTE